MNSSSRRRLTFLTFVMPNDYALEVFAADTLPAVQTQAFGLKIIALLEATGADCKVLSFAPSQDFPISKRLCFKSSTFHLKTVECRILPYLNLPILKLIIRLLVLLVFIPSLAIGRRDIVLHGLHSPYLIFGLICRFFGRQVYCIITDDVGVILPTDGRLRRLAKRIDAKLIKFFCCFLNGGIALSQSLATKFFKDGRYIVVPGIIDSSAVRPVSAPHLDDQLVACYFGGLGKGYGALTLAQACHYVTRPVTVKIFGAGEEAESIAKLSSSLIGLEFHGFIERGKLHSHVAAFDILVNPRPVDSTLAQFSSPSKLFEFAELGKPVITTRLPTIPTDIIELAFVADDSSAMGLARLLDEVAMMSQDDRAKRAYLFQQAMLARYSTEAVAKEFARLIAR